MKKDLKSPSGWKTKGYIPIILKPQEDYKIIKEAKFDKGMMLGYRLFPPYIDKSTEDIYQLPNIHTHSCGELTYDSENSGINEKELDENVSKNLKFINGINDNIDDENIDRNIEANRNDDIYLDFNGNRNDDIYLEYNDYIGNRQDYNDDNISHYSLSDQEDMPQTPGSVSYPINIINSNRNNDETLDSPNSNSKVLICNEIEFIYLTIPKESLLELMDSLDRLSDDDIRSGSSPGFGFGVEGTLKGIFYKIIKVEDKVGFAYQRRLSGEFN
ncbi:5247_t:CDS:2 [Dentiscutata heterogama]|uniref:5247_t:CDS:1 n=1 Tax=Dentiscutata heterogama TaxID=1316150 RepID=A0ACA9JXU9_9GLOM|nr:5247_t:CDS:2 [Dentiscutata heterogama]